MNNIHHQSKTKEMNKILQIELQNRNNHHSVNNITFSKYLINKSTNPTKPTFHSLP